MIKGLWNSITLRLYEEIALFYYDLNFNVIINYINASTVIEIQIAHQ